MSGINVATDVKICGLQSVEVLKSIVHLPIDQIGFVFAPSRRRVTAGQAADMISFLKQSSESGGPIPLTVGVFVNPALDELAEILAVAPLDIVQFHGDETPENCALIKERFQVQLWKVASIQNQEQQGEPGSFSNSQPSSPDRVNNSAVRAVEDRKSEYVHSVINRLIPYKDIVDAVLVDTFDPVYGGGSGRTFAWDCIPEVQRWARSQGLPVIVAGGLNVDNVGGLVDTYRPDGVDVSSGVETQGVKDIAKIAAFVGRVKKNGNSTT
ncbi:phosphoribosylanthranilate isomerase [Paenibacillus sp. FJAT-26967]|uniref:phosphoribosylanthranilate isomerase n=1 Tax=Paenibacillus sp. FJAT-26967 TaxID=1729690 RepID=UPI0008390844|nr:phosphoribosylanthranilate isomerase [Paenibacillus sp. FJAT-26967]